VNIRGNDLECGRIGGVNSGIRGGSPRKKHGGHNSGHGEGGLTRRYKTQLSMATWRGYANLLLDRTKYVGMGQAAPKRAHIILTTRDKGDA
jgi:hypothetical protein